MSPYLVFTLKTEPIQYASCSKDWYLLAYSNISVFEAYRCECKAETDRFRSVFIQLRNIVNGLSYVKSQLWQSIKDIKNSNLRIRWSLSCSQTLARFYATFAKYASKLLMISLHITTYPSNYWIPSISLIIPLNIKKRPLNYWWYPFTLLRNL